MATVHSIPELDRKGLREFGLTTGAAVVVIFGVFFPWILGFDWPSWPWIVAAPLWALALIRPLWLRRIYRAWMHFGLLASRVMTPLVLGMVWRRTGRDSLQRTLDPNRKSYRVQSTKSPREKLERPF
jgi:hypothetical protein